MYRKLTRFQDQEMIWLPGRFSDTVASRMLSPTALINAGPPVIAPSFWLVTSTTIPLLLPSSILGYQRSKTWSAYSKASALLYKQNILILCESICHNTVYRLYTTTLLNLKLFLAIQVLPQLVRQMTTQKSTLPLYLVKSFKFIIPILSMFVWFFCTYFQVWHLVFTMLQYYKFVPTF